MLQLFTDTDTDMTPEDAAYYGFRLISMPYSVNGETVYPYEDFTVFDAKGFYDSLRGGALPSTSAISEQRYTDYFEPVFAAGDDILYVHFSAAMSATFDAMRRAVDPLLEKYPERRFYTVDTKGITTMSYIIVREIAERYKAGATAEEILRWSETEVEHYSLYFFADDLKFFQHSGRVSNLAGTMGTLLGVRPIIYMNSEGQMTSIGKERGRARAMERLLTTVKELGDDVAAHRIVIGHTDAVPLAEEFSGMLRQEFGEGLDIELRVVNPTAGAHCGPNGIGVCFHAIHR